MGFNPYASSSVSEYGELSKILGRAFDMAARGKGHERHGSDEKWETQSSFVLDNYFSTPFLFQAAKKMAEGQRLGKDAMVREYLGAITYLAMEIWREEKGVIL